MFELTFFEVEISFGIQGGRIIQVSKSTNHLANSLVESSPCRGNSSIVLEHVFCVAKSPAVNEKAIHELVLYIYYF